MGEIKNYLGLNVGRVDVPQRSVVVREIAGVQNLESGVMLAVEESLSGRAAHRDGSGRRTEPQTQVIHLNGIERRGETGVVLEHDRRRRGTLRERERLDS